jgi:hypothetical protein
MGDLSGGAAGLGKFEFAADDALGVVFRGIAVEAAAAALQVG